MNLKAPSLFSFQQNISYLSRSANECMFHVEDDAVYKLIPLEDSHVLAEIRSDGEAGINIRYCGETGEAPSDPTIDESVTRYVEDWLDLRKDLTPFYQLAETDPLLHEAVNRSYGLRLIGISDLFEAVCWGIMGQQINLAFAYTLKRRFVETYGSHVQWNGRQYWRFPSPEVIASLTVDDIAALQMTGKKSEYLIGVARLIAEGTLTKHALLQAGSLKAAEKQLTAIRGIGPWTANYVLMRCLRYGDAFPIDDVGLHNAIGKMLGLEGKPTIEQIRQLSSGWNGWEAYATFYLWRVLY